MLPEPTTEAGGSPSLGGHRHHHHHRHRHHHRRRARTPAVGDRIIAGFARHRPLLLALIVATGLLGLLLLLYRIIEQTSVEQYAGG